MKKLSVFVLLLCSSIVQMLSAQDLPHEKCYFPDSMHRRQLMTRSGDQLLEQIHHPSASELAAQSAELSDPEYQPPRINIPDGRQCKFRYTK